MCSYFPMHDIVLSNWSNWPQSSSSNRLSAQKTLFSIQKHTAAKHTSTQAQARRSKDIVHKHTAGATYADQIDFQTAIDSPSHNRTRIVCKSGFLQDKLRVLCLYIISDPKIFKWMRHMDPGILQLICEFLQNKLEGALSLHYVWAQDPQVDVPSLLHMNWNRYDWKAPVTR